METDTRPPGDALQIGWATGDLTPAKPVLLDGQFHARLSTGVKDPLTVTALALQAGSDPRGQAVLVSCDMVGVDHAVLADIRRALAPMAPGFDPRHLIVSATHTHTAMVLCDDKYPLPEADLMTPRECREFLVRRVADAAAAAWNSRKPGGISWACAEAVVGHNRRAVFADGSAKMYAETNDPNFVAIEGGEDHGVRLLFTRSPDGELTGAVVNLACPSQETEGEQVVSADFWHETRLAIRSRWGNDLPILAQCAPAGDQSPHFLLNREAERIMRERRGLSSRQVIAEKIARAFADGVELAGAEAPARRAVIRHDTAELLLPRRRVTDAEYARAVEECAALERDDTMHPSVRHSFLRRNREVIRRYRVQAAEPAVPAELHALRIGDVAIVTNPFELFLDYGIRIVARSRAPVTFPAQITCGYEGYLPTRKAVGAALHAQDRKHPGFSGNYGAGVASNRVGPEGGDALVEWSVARINALWGDPDCAE